MGNKLLRPLYILADRKTMRSFQALGEEDDVDSKFYGWRRSEFFWRIRASLWLASAQHYALRSSAKHALVGHERGAPVLKNHPPFFLLVRLALKLRSLRSSVSGRLASSRSETTDTLPPIVCLAIYSIQPTLLSKSPQSGHLRWPSWQNSMIRWPHRPGSVSRKQGGARYTRCIQIATVSVPQPWETVPGPPPVPSCR